MMSADLMLTLARDRQRELITEAARTRLFPTRRRRTRAISTPAAPVG
jgi:hypothetical protein